MSSWLAISPWTMRARTGLTDRQRHSFGYTLHRPCLSLPPWFAAPIAHRTVSDADSSRPMASGAFRIDTGTLMDRLTRALPISIRIAP